MRVRHVPMALAALGMLCLPAAGQGETTPKAPQLVFPSQLNMVRLDIAAK